jgi:hypothetical protein
MKSCDGETFSPRLTSKARTRTWGIYGVKFWLVLWMVLRALASANALDREAFTFSKYDLNVQIEPEQQRLSVRGKIVLRNDSSVPQKNAVLQISSSLTWRSIQADGKPLQFVSQPFTSDVDHTGALSEAIVSLPAAVPPGGGVELEIGYEGVIMLDTTRLTRIGMPKEMAVHSDWDQIDKAFSAVRGVGYVAWYPIATEVGNLSEGNSVFEVVGRWKKRELKAEMKTDMHRGGSNEETRLVLMCTASGSQSAVNAVSVQTADVHCNYSSIGMNVPAFLLANYGFLDRPAAQVAYLPERQTNAEKFAQAADAVTPFVKEWFGTPREKAQIIELADPGASPFESGVTLLTPLNDTDPKLLQIALVHELTHAAFPSPRPWIYEGLAHFAQAALREHQSSRTAALDFLALHRTAVTEAEKQMREQANGDGSDQALISTTIDEFYRSKAAYVWWMLKDMLGEEVIQKALALYESQKDTEPGYMQRLLETQSKRELQWFFDDWVYQDRGLPDFKVESAYVGTASQGNYLTTVTIENLGSAGAEVPVSLHFDGGELGDRVVVRGKAKGVVRIATPKVPTQVTVNDGSVPESDMSNNSFKVTGPASARP